VLSCNIAGYLVWGGWMAGNEGKEGSEHIGGMHTRHVVNGQAYHGERKGAGEQKRIFLSR